jgi:hypothetical protein
VEELAAGLYEVLVTEGLQVRLEDLAERLPTEQRGLQAAEAPDRIAWHLSREIERALNDVGENDRARVGIEVARALIDRLGELVSADPSVRPVDPATVLHAVLGRRPDGTPDAITTPLTPLLDTTLLTNAPGEPNLWNQLRSEIESADAIDVVMAFIRRSGISPLLDALARHCDRGRPLRVLTTTYTGSTEQRYWAGGDYLPYDAGQFEAEQQRAGRESSGPTVILSPIELRPLPFPGPIARARRGVASTRPPSQSPGVGNRHREDGYGGPRLRGSP